MKIKNWENWKKNERIFSIFSFYLFVLLFYLGIFDNSYIANIKLIDQL